LQQKYGRTTKSEWHILGLNWWCKSTEGWMNSWTGDLDQFRTYDKAIQLAEVNNCSRKEVIKYKTAKKILLALLNQIETLNFMLLYICFQS
jgi:hypothetical protein